MVFRRRFMRNGRRQAPQRRVPRKNKITKLVTGASLTRFQRIAQQPGQVGALARSLRYVVNSTNAEHKYIDITGVSTTVSTLSPYIVGLTNVAQGQTSVTRIGDSIKLQSIQINILTRALYKEISTPQGFVTFRIMIIVDKQKNGTAPTTLTISDLLSSVGLLSMRNINFSDRFIVLKDKFTTHNQMYTVTALTEGTERYTKVFIPLDFHTRYVGTSAAESSNSNNSIYLFAIADDATALGGQFLTFASRVVFTDD